jgi:hypothetical protein
MVYQPGATLWECACSNYKKPQRGEIKSVAFYSALSGLSDKWVILFHRVLPCVDISNLFGVC